VRYKRRGRVNVGRPEKNVIGSAVGRGEGPRGLNLGKAEEGEVDKGSK
jgi:hypothetical protein